MLIQTTPWDKRDMDIIEYLAVLTEKRKLLPFWELDVQKQC